MVRNSIWTSFPLLPKVRRPLCWSWNSQLPSDRKSNAGNKSNWTWLILAWDLMKRKVINKSPFCVPPLSEPKLVLVDSRENLTSSKSDPPAFPMHQLLAGLFTPRGEENLVLLKCPQFVLQYLLHMWKVAVPKMCCMVSCYPMLERQRSLKCASAFS